MPSMLARFLAPVLLAAACTAGPVVDPGENSISPGPQQQTPGTPGNTDLDDDGVPNSEDNCPTNANEDQADGDEDGIGDVCDQCPSAFDPEQPEEPCPAPTPPEDEDPCPDTDDDLC